MLIVIEITSVILNLLYLLFAIRQHSGAWIFGIVASFLSMFLFYKNQYWGSVCLNGIYVLQGLFGFFQWQFYLKKTLPSFRISLQQHLLILAGIAALFTLILYISGFSTFHLYIKLDILLSIASIVATFLEIKKDISCWYYWIVLNLCFTLLYSLQHLYLYAGLMLILGVFSVFALREWKKNSTD